MIRTRLAATVLTLLALAGARPAAAAWPHEPNNGNVALCTAAGEQQVAAAVSDGAGGVIVSWNDSRSGTNDIYVQRISAAGVPQWTANGVALCTATANQSFPTITPDGAGGAIVTWQDYRSGTNSDIYAQRINSAGAVQWTANGVALCTVGWDQLYPTIVPDGAGGAVVTWRDFRSNVNNDIYAQRISASGAAQWTANGVALCTASGDQYNPTIASDGAGGAIVTWYDQRSGADYDLYAQRISAAGATQWTANGAVLCNAAGYQLSPVIIADGAGGAIATWRDVRSGLNSDVYAQRLSASGVAQWTPNGVPVCAATAEQYGAMLTSDGAGGAVIAWYDYRGSGSDIYSQRISASGAPQWAADGVALCTAANEQASPAVASDGAGGAIVTWYDYRSGTNYDIYAQRINVAGAIQWAANGVALCTAAGSQNYPVIVPDGAGGAIVAWEDPRGGSGKDLYAQRVERFGKLGSPEPSISAVTDIPNDQGGRVRLAWDASYLDTENDADLTAYDVFHSVPPNLAAQEIASAGNAALRLGEVPVEGGPRYLFTMLGTEQYAWEYVSTVNPQHFLTSYGSTQATTGDSIAGSNSTTSFMVVGRNAAGSKYWLSAPGAGYSVDNLAPAAPAPLTGQYAAGTTTLHWNRNTEADLAGYRLYRGATAAFAPGPANFVSALSDTGTADAPGSPYVYKLTAVDAHGNESPVATLIPSGTTGVGDGAPLALSFAAPSPNPTRGAATLRYTLSRAGHVRLSVYDAAGRRVATLHDGVQEAGAHAASFALRDAAGREFASGLYLLQLEAEGRVLTRRLATIR